MFGIAVGNSILGVALDERGVFTGTFLDLLGLYPVLVGLLVAALFAMHGALYLCLKIPVGSLLSRVKEWVWHTWGVFLVLYVVVTMYTLLYVPHAARNIYDAPWLGAIAVVNVLAIANVPRAAFHDRFGQAFLSSVVTIALLVGLFGVAQFPNLVTASNEPDNSLTIYNAASSERTLGIMLIIASIGVPLVLAYTAIVYWTFRRRVKAEPEGY